MSHELTLKIKVDSLERLQEIRTFAADLQRLGPSLKSSLSGASQSARALNVDFTDLRKDVQSGFSSLTVEFQKLAAGIREIGQAAKASDVDAEAVFKRRKARTREEAKEQDDLTGKAAKAEQQSRDLAIRSSRVRQLEREKEWRFTRDLEINSSKARQREREREVREHRRAQDQMAADAAAAEQRRINLQRTSARIESARRVQAWREAARLRDLDAAFLTSSPSSQLRVANRASKSIELGGSTEDVTRKYGAAAVALAQNAQAYKTLRAEVGATTTSKKVAASQTNALRTSVVDHTNKVLGANDAYALWHSTMRGVAGGMGQIWLSWGKPLAALWAGFTVSSGAREAIKQFAAFEHQLTVVSAVSGESEEGIRRIGQEALKLGRESIFGPQELASGLRILAQAGLDAQKAMQVLPTVADFATVGEMGMGPAAQSLIGITTAFGQPLSTIEHVADVIGKAAAISQTSVENMTGAIRQASAVAEQYGADINEVSAILATLAKRNIEGTIAGTSMRNAFKEIYTPSEKAKAVLQELGVSAYDAATKKAKPMIQVMEELRASLIRFDKETQNQAFQIIFGERGGKVGSAALSSIDAIKVAFGELSHSAGFVSEAALRIEESISSRWTIALNNLRSSLISAGEAAKGSLSAITSEFEKLFASKEFQNAITFLATSVASLIEYLVKNGDKLALIFGTYLGAKAAGGLINLGLAARNAARGVADTAKQFALSRAPMEAFGTGLATAAAASGGLVGAFGRLGGVIGTGAAFLGRFLGPLGLVIAGVEAAAMAWDFYKKKQDNALNQLPDKGETFLQRVDKLLEQNRAKMARLATEVKFGTKPNEELDSFTREIKRIEAERDEAIDRARKYQSGEALAQTEQALRQSFGRKIGEVAGRQEEYKRLAEEIASSEFVLQKRSEANSRLPEGGLSKDFQSLVKRGGRQYTDPIGSIISNTEGMYKDSLRDADKAFSREQALLQKRFDARVISEERLNDELERLARERAEFEEREAHKHLNETLPRLFEERRQRILRDYAKDPEKQKDQLRALEADFMNRFGDAARNYRDASINREHVGEISDLERTARENKLYDSLQKQREASAREAREAQAQWDLQFVDATTRAVEQKRLQVEQQWSDIRLKAQQSTNEKWKAAVEEAYRHAQEVAQEVARTQAEAEKDWSVGARRGIRSYLDEINNLSKASESLVQNTAKGVEDLFVNMAKTGKFAIKDLVDTVLAEFTRIQVREGIVGPLLKFAGSFFTPGTSESANTLNAYNMSLANTRHLGGLVGYASPNPSRLVPSSAFLGAPRFHGGGYPGLYPGEVPIIAKKGELVLTEAQQANVANALSGATQTPSVEVNVINNGQPATVADTQTTFDGKKMVVNVVLEDLSRNGPIAQRLKAPR